MVGLTSPFERENNSADGITVDVIVPVYGGLEETRRCLESAIASRSENRSFGRLIVIDDCGPEPELRRLLPGISEREEGVDLFVNDSNLGFVKSVNKGMRASDRDVVLLNADTEVHADWLDRLTRQAYADGRTATVTPFSNNATICTFPQIGGSPHMPFGKALAEIDNAFAAANAGRQVDIPTGVGFCMYIRRAALEELGDFDEAFGRGYGEETDFCQKALNAGWRNVLAGDTFVFHHGSVSFGAGAAAEQMVGGAIMRERYPDYEPSVGRWINSDPALALRFNAMAALLKADPRPVLLHLLHPWGGGTEKQVSEIAAKTPGAQHLILITRRIEGGLALSLLVPEGRMWRRFAFSVDRLSAAASVLAGFGVARMHVHHALEIMEDLPAFVSALGIPYDLSIHDYALVCPRNNLILERGLYCGEPDETGCLSCLRRDPPGRSRDIVWWRHNGINILEGADRVICPTVDVALRVRRYAPGASLLAVPHEAELYHPTREYSAPSLRPGEKLRIAMLGVFAEHKGGLFLLECIERALRADTPIEWTLIGFFPEGLAQRARALSSTLTVTGPYDSDKVHELIEQADPHLIFFPQHCVETYSYTLSEALDSKRGILAPNLGAFPERVAGVDGCWIYDHNWSAFEVLGLLQDFVHKVFETGDPSAMPQAMHATDSTVAVDRDFYRERYLRPATESHASNGVPSKASAPGLALSHAIGSKSG